MACLPYTFPYSITLLLLFLTSLITYHLTLVEQSNLVDHFCGFCVCSAFSVHGLLICLDKERDPLFSSEAVGVYES